MASMMELRKVGQRQLAEQLSDSLTFGEFLRDFAAKKTILPSTRGSSDELTQRFLYPILASTVCTCSHEALDRYPAKIILETLDQLNGSEPLQKTKFGSRDAVQRLALGLTDIRLRTNVESISEHDENVCIESRREDGQTNKEHFDQLIVATQANHTANIVSRLARREQQLIEPFKYESVLVSVHTDTKLLPPQKKHWATFNFVSGDERRNSSCHVLLNRFHADWQIAQPVIQSIGDLTLPRDDHVLHQFSLQRPVVTADSFDAWSRIQASYSENDRRIWFCGSYASRGVPLLETAVVSSQQVVQRLNTARFRRHETSSKPLA